MVAVIRPSQRLDEINLLLRSHKAAADTGGEKTKTPLVSDLTQPAWLNRYGQSPGQRRDGEKYQNLMQLLLEVMYRKDKQEVWGWSSYLMPEQTPTLTDESFMPSTWP